MTTRRTRVKTMIRDANPVPDVTAGSRGALDARERADVNAILASGRTPVRAPGTPRGAPAASWPRRLVLVGAAAVTAAAVLVSGVVDLPGSGPGLQAPEGAYAATPPPLAYAPVSGDASGVLNGIAERTASLPDERGSGDYATVTTQGWYLNTEVDGERVTSVVVPQTVTMWKSADGSGRVRREHTLPGQEPTVSDEEAAPGQLGMMWPLGSLSSDDQVLAAQLEEAHPVQNGPYERLVSIADAYRDQPITPPVRAAMLRYLAATPGLSLDGEVTDRLGRPGLAVSVDTTNSGLPTRHTLVIDPSTGAVLGEEQMLTTDAGRLNVPVPSVISYTAFKASRYVPAVE